MKELAQDHAACEMVDREFKPSPVWLSLCASQEKNLDLFYFGPQKLFPVKPLLWVGNYAKHLPLPPLAGRLSREILFWGFVLQ